MTLTVRRIDREEHLAFIRTRPAVSFLQTPAWAKVKQEWRSESIGWFDGEDLVGAALVLHRPVPRIKSRTLAYLPEGPTIDWSGDLAAWLDPLTRYLRSVGAFAVRIGPPVWTCRWSAEQVKSGIADDAVLRLSEMHPTERNPVGAAVRVHLQSTGWLLQSPEDGFGAGQPHYTFEIPLAGRSEADVLAGMNQLWRRNIKRAERDGVEVRVSLDLSDVAAFHELYLHTAERDHFTPRPLSYFEQMFRELSAEDSGRIKLYLARHEGDLVAATIVIQVGAHTWYSYGASSTEKREVRGSNALQWAMVRDALAAGCDVYDLRGITPTLDASDSHVGLIQFKVGTGGQAVEYVGEWDLPLRPLFYKAFVAYMARRGR